MALIVIPFAVKAALILLGGGILAYGIAELIDELRAEKGQDEFEQIYKENWHRMSPEIRKQFERRMR